MVGGVLLLCVLVVGSVVVVDFYVVSLCLVCMLSFVKVCFMYDLVDVMCMFRIVVVLGMVLLDSRCL